MYKDYYLGHLQKNLRGTVDQIATELSRLPSEATTVSFSQYRGGVAKVRVRMCRLICPLTWAQFDLRSPLHQDLDEMVRVARRAHGLTAFGRPAKGKTLLRETRQDRPGERRG